MTESLTEKNSGLSRGRYTGEGATRVKQMTQDAVPRSIYQTGTNYHMRHAFLPALRHKSINPYDSPLKMRSTINAKSRHNLHKEARVIKARDSKNVRKVRKDTVGFCQTYTVRLDLWQRSVVHNPQGVERLSVTKHETSETNLLSIRSETSNYDPSNAQPNVHDPGL